jgi:hypothetical protein
LTPEWSPRKREPLRARERPLRANGSVSDRSCGAPESVEAVTAKPVAGEQTGRAYGDLERDAQYGCMPVVSKAGNRVTWNHFLLADAFSVRLQLQFPILSHEILSEAMVAVLLHQPEAGAFVNLPGRRQHVVCP